MPAAARTCATEDVDERYGCAGVGRELEVENSIHRHMLSDFGDEGLDDTVGLAAPMRIGVMRLARFAEASAPCCSFRR